MKLLVIALGSAGDVHPFVGLGGRLRRSGHQVSLFANEVFRQTVEGYDLDFVPLGDAEYFRRITEHPDMFHPRRGTSLVFSSLAAHLSEITDTLLEHLEPGRTVLVASSLALAARLVQDTRGVPLATVHLQPAVLRSVYRAPRLPGAPLPDWTPRWWKRLWWWLADRVVLDPLLRPALDAETQRLGLPRVHRPLHLWWHSPQLVLGLFPAWFAPPQPDWPPQLELTGFPLFDEGELHSLDADLEGWLEAGQPPVVATAGSAHHHAAAFYAAVTVACQRLGRRLVLLTRHRKSLPPELPADTVHREYVPFSRLLPRATALVHHGGIGTAAQGLAAGIPQLVVPFSHDQPDNAARLEALGVGATVPAPRLDPERLSRSLGSLLDAPGARRSARILAERMRTEDAVDAACRRIESLEPQ